MIFEGSAVAIVTPFDESNNINYFELKNLINFQIASNTKAIVLLGTTGESSTVTPNERTKLIKFAKCVIDGRVPLIVGTGSNSTKTAIEQSKEAEHLGASAVLVVTPYYNKCNQAGLYNHYKAIASSINIPVIIYNVPSRTSVSVSPETVIKLSKIKNIVAIKEASGNLAQIEEIISGTDDDFAVYSGDDGLTLPLLSIGAKGVISVTANCYPEWVQRLCDFALSGDFFNAKKCHYHLKQINKGLFLDVNPIPVKHYLTLQGFMVGKPRPPLFEADKKLKQKLKEIFNIYEN